MKRGRPKNGVGKEATINDCHYCEGTGFHFSRTKPCQACDGSGKEIVRKQLQKVYNAKNGLPINHNLEI